MCLLHSSWHYLSVFCSSLFFLLCPSCVCHFFVHHQTCLRGSWPAQSLEITHQPWLRLLLEVQSWGEGCLPCLCRLQLDWALAFSFFPPLPLTLTQALLGVPGCLPDTQICLILTRQNGSPNFRTTSQMPTKVDQTLHPNYPFRLFQDLDEARSCSKNTSLYSVLGAISLLGKWGLEEWEQRFPVHFSHVLSFQIHVFVLDSLVGLNCFRHTAIHGPVKRTGLFTFYLLLSSKWIQLSLPLKLNKGICLNTPLTEQLFILHIYLYILCKNL